MKIKLFLLSLMGVFLCSAKVAEQQPSPFPAYDAYSQKPVTREEIESMLISPEFQELAQELMPGASIDMSPEEREAIIQDTLNFAQKMEGLTPEEQQQELEAMFKQLPQPPSVGKKEPVPAPVPVQPSKPQPDKKPAPKPIKNLTDTKSLLEKTTKLIENVELQLGSLLRVTSDNYLEQKWAEVKQELPFTISLLKRITTKETLLENFATQEYKLLQTQIKDLYTDLKKEQKRLSIPDTAQLTTLSPEDAARAELMVNDTKKEISKDAVKKIINILSRSVQNINYGCKKLFEKYAPTELKEIEKKFPTKQPRQESSSSKESPSSRGYGDDSYYSPYYGGGSPYYGDRSDYYKPSSEKKGSGKTSPSKEGKKVKTGKESSKETDEKDSDKKAGKAADKKDLAKEDKEKSPDKIAEARKTLKETIDSLEEQVKDLFDNEFTDTMSSLATLDINNNDDRESISAPRQALQEINPLLTQLNGEIIKFIGLMKNAKDEILDNQKKTITDYLKKQKSIEQLVEIAKAFTTEEMKRTFAEQDEKKMLIDKLNDFLSYYQTIIDQLKTYAALDKQQEELNTTLNEKIKKNNLISLINNRREISQTVKAELITILEHLEKYLTLSTQMKDRYKKAKKRPLSGEAAQLVATFDSNHIPGDIRSNAKSLKKQLA